jgi:oligopeptide transport system substrate-binding protein
MYLPARSLTPPNCSGYTARAQVSDDFSEARRLLAEAGYPGGRGLPAVEVQCYDDDVKLRVLEAIQSMWQRELGFHVTIAQMEQKTLFQNQQSFNYTIAFSGWSADIPDPVTFLGTMVTGGGNNWAGWSNREFDRLIGEAANTGDNSLRYEYFQKAEAILLDDAPLIPLYFYDQTYAINPAVRGYSTNLMDLRQLEKVWLEK